VVGTVVVGTSVGGGDVVGASVGGDVAGGSCVVVVSTTVVALCSSSDPHPGSTTARVGSTITATKRIFLTK
jgi:hypothetical protein